ncbi:helix-turn-helix domain-containing protein [Lactiplantibacillus pentosus]|uniref:helix-turn-helix domain-containing protein n=1 Tax=Lactiplantibacillus pentosus TaxID=1589 RepID=UPI0021A3526A|nr:helix-turn-helix domain-containing protein [Lactiplantibacillus pentosus]MCT3309960.1 hypothetical protein [Lactiplantibacillus pentosus]
MHLFDLLDKSEQRQIKIIQLILRHSQTVSIGQIIAELDSNRLTIKKDIGLINAKFGQFSKNLTLVLKDGYLYLERDITTSADEIYAIFLTNSVKYKILIYLLSHKSIDTCSIIETLNISISTYERRAKELNQVLADFHLKIHNGQLSGSERQIRHFYLQLLWFARPYQTNQREFDSPRVQAILHELSQTNGQLFTEAGEMKLNIYLAIVNRRYHAGVIHAKKIPLNFDSPLYHQLHQAFQTYFSTNAYRSLDAEAEVQQLFLFLISNYCFNVDIPFIRYGLQQEVDNIAAVQSVHHEISNDIRVRLLNYKFSEDFLVRIDISLIQTHFRAVFMRGWMAIFGKAGIYDQLIDLPEASFFNITSELNEKICQLLGLNPHDRAELISEISGRYAAIFHLAFRNIDYQLKIGCDFGYEAVMADIIIDKLKQRIDFRLKYTIEPYQRHHQYDIIISNLDKKYPHQQHSRNFVMLSTEYDSDFYFLNRFLEKRYLHQLKSLGNTAGGATERT